MLAFFWEERIDLRLLMSPMRFAIYFFFSVFLVSGTVRPAARSSVSLDGDWHFQSDPNGTLDEQKLASAAFVRPTRVPSSWQLQFADLRDYAGVAWYWRTITVEPPAADQVALLHFGAVDYTAGGYVSFRNACY